jgi:hypothetical protein
MKTSYDHFLPKYLLRPIYCVRESLLNIGVGQRHTPDKISLTQPIMLVLELGTLNRLLGVGREMEKFALKQIGKM